MEKKIKVGFITLADPLDKRSWSGIYYQMFTSLARTYDVVALGPLTIPRMINISLFYLNKAHLFLFKKSYNHRHNIILSKYYHHALKKKIEHQNLDILFAPAASTAIAYLKTKIPIIYLSDTSFDQIRSYYHAFSGISKLSVTESNHIEKRAIKNSAVQIYSSTWASEYVIKRYNANPENIAIVKFGANIEDPPDTIIKDYSGTIRLLFLGVEWVRKGGDIAVQAFEILLKRGCRVQLTVCGCTPPVNYANVNVIPFLNKNVPAEVEVFRQLLIDTHLLLLPTRADCTPLVFGEVNAYGILAITTDTGGVASIIENGVNGYALPLQASASDYADTIEGLINDQHKLKSLAATARHKYEQELNWNVWSEKVSAVISTLLAGTNKK